MSTAELTEEELNQLSKETLIKMIYALQGNVTELTRTVQNLTEQIMIMNQRRFGRKTEAVSELQLALDLGFNEAEYTADPDKPEPTLNEAAPKKKRPKGKRAEDISKVTNGCRNLRLTTTVYTAARAAHNFDEVVVCFSVLNAGK